MQFDIFPAYSNVVLGFDIFQEERIHTYTVSWEEKGSYWMRVYLIKYDGYCG